MSNTEAESNKIVDTESSNVTIDTSSQISASDQLVTSCKEIYDTARKNDLAWRWMLGKLVEETYTNKEKYESSILKRLSEELDIAVSDLSRFRKFFNEFTDSNAIDTAAERGYSWSHFKVLNDLPDGSIKTELRKEIDTDAPAPKTSEFQKEIDKKKSEILDRADASADADSRVSGSSTGSKESKSSPITPVNKALKAVEVLGDYLGDIIIKIDEGIDFDDDKKQEKFNESLSELILKMREMTEYAKKIEDLTT